MLCACYARVICVLCAGYVRALCVLCACDVPAMCVLCECYVRAMCMLCACFIVTPNSAAQKILVKVTLGEGSYIIISHSAQVSCMYTDVRTRNDEHVSTRCHGVHRDC